MNTPQTEQQLRETNVPVLTNCVELASQIVLKVAGNDIANAVGGETVTPAYLQEAVAARLQSLLAPSMGVARHDQ